MLAARPFYLCTAPQGFDNTGRIIPGKWSIGSALNEYWACITNVSPTLTIPWTIICAKICWFCYSDAPTLAQQLASIGPMFCSFLLDQCLHWEEANLPSFEKPHGGWPVERCNTFYTSQETKLFFQFEIIVNVLVTSFRFIWIPMLWVYDH